MAAFYNEIDPVAAHVLECLIKDKVIADGIVDRRSIADIDPKELASFTQAHFFAGGGLWSVAARMAGWPDDRPLWTGSCPCQPFSVAGKGLGEDDPRHLWPHFFRLIRAVRPPFVVGEQVAAAAARSRKDLPELWGLKAIRRVLREQEGARLELLQGLRDGKGTPEESWLQDAEIGFFQDLEIEESNQGYDFRSEVSRETTGASVRSRPIRNGTGCSFAGGVMRDDGHTSLPRWEPGMERSISGSDLPTGRIHDSERARGGLRTQRHDEQLGRKPRSGDCRRITEAAREAERFLLGTVRAELDAQIGRNWLDGITDDLEEIQYSVRTVSLGACSVDAPHIRQRLYWCANNMVDSACVGRREGWPEHELRGGRSASAGASGIHLADTDEQGLEGRRPAAERPDQQPAGSHGVADADGCGRGGRQEASERVAQRGTAVERARGDVADADNPRSPRSRGEPQHECAKQFTCDDYSEEGRSFWSDYEWRSGADGKARRVKSDLRLLAHGVPGRVGQLRIAGNAIVPQVAAEVLKALIETQEIPR